MPALDAPDFETIITTVASTGAVPDAPDFQTIAVGPGGQPVGPPAGGSITTPYLQAGLCGLSCDPVTVNNSEGHTEGAVALLVFTALASVTVNYLWIYVAAGAVCTANENYVALYDWGQATPATFTRLAVSAAGTCDPLWDSNGLHKIALSSGAPVVAGQNYAMALLNNGGAPSFANVVPLNTAFINPYGNTWPIRSVSPATFTTMPATLAFSAVTVTNVVWLMYASNA